MRIQLAYRSGIAARGFSFLSPPQRCDNRASQRLVASHKVSKGSSRIYYGNMTHRVEMQANGNLVQVRVADPVQSESIAHVRHAVLFVRRVSLDDQAVGLGLPISCVTCVLSARVQAVRRSRTVETVGAALTRPAVYGFLQGSFQDLHDTLESNDVS